MTKHKIPIIIFLLHFFLSFNLFSHDIHKAVKAKEFNAVRILLKKDPKLAISQNSTGDTPLHLAAESGHDEIAELLISMTENVNIKNNRGLTSLFFAVFYGRKNIAKMLLAKGANTNIKSDIGMYPIHYAVYANRVGVLELLIKYRADMNLEDEDRRTPLELALFQGHKRVIDILLQNKSKIRVRTKSDGIQDLHAAARIGHSALLKKMVQLGIDIHSKDFMHRTLLHNAAAGGLVNIITDLLQIGKKIDVRDVYGSTPLHEAAYNGHKEIVVLLISKGADINSKRPDGATPLYLAKKAGHKDIVSILKAKGAVDTPLRFPELTGDYLGQKPPGMKPEIFAPGILNTDKMGAFCSVFSPDGNEFYFVYYKKADESCDIFWMRNKNDKWTKPEKLHFNSTTIDADMCMSADGNMLIFCSFRVLPNGKKPKNHTYLWFVNRTNQGWSTAKPLFCGGEPVRTGYPSISNNGTIYFAHRRNNRLGIYRSRLINNKYNTPEYIYTVFNHDFIHGDMFVAPDESYMIISGRDRHGKIGYGRLDLYIIFYKSESDGTWSKAINMGDSINTQYGENCPQISPDGKYFFFNRYNPDLKKGDIYWVDAKIIETYKPKDTK